ncbi:MAG TPA: hypothetical protein VG347_13505 [Verrucomicrobiae bacterium]|nr:hypothetical protein [Verrucomicrobiae bacterium]
MKKLIVATLAIICASAVVLQAQDATMTPKKSKLTPEQQTVMTEMLAKYDTDKNGKLDKTERAAMTQEDKDKMTKAGLGPKKKKAPMTDSSTNAPAGGK